MTAAMKHGVMPQRWIRWLLYAAIVVVACAGPDRTETASRAAESTGAPRSAEAPAKTPAETLPAPGQADRGGTVTATAAAPEEEPEITIDRIGTSNPLVVEGRARTFENNVALRVRNRDGAVLASGFTTSRGEAGQRNPFRGELWIPVDPEGAVIVEALEYSAKDGSERSLVSRMVAYDVAPVTRILHFPDSSCEKTIGLRRTMPSSVSAARLLVEALIAGPTPEEAQKGATSPFPGGAAVRSVTLRGGTLTVDFNERLRNVGGSCRARSIRLAVNETLRALPGVERVVITAAGSEPLALQP
jgi:hypothetical protein